MKTAMISSVLLILLGATGSGVSAQPGAPARERFVLTGMVVWSEKEGVAWLQEPEFTRNEIVTVRIGENVGPWKLTQFLENGVELDGPAGKVLVPLGAPGSGAPASAVAAGAPANTATASPARPVPANDAARVAAPAAPVSSDPGYVWESNRPVPGAGAFGEALNQARAARAQRQAGNAQEQPRQGGTAAGQAARGASTAPGGAPSDGASGAGSSGTTTNQVIQFPVGGGKQGFRELFGTR